MRLRREKPGPQWIELQVANISGEDLQDRVVTTAFISTYLFSEPPHLNDLWERNGESTHQYWTLAKPAYVQTHKQTFSGAEEFSYNLKNLKRATIIGETTGGGAHPISGHRIDDHFMIGVPFARTINPSPQPTGKERVSSPP